MRVGGCRQLYASANFGIGLLAQPVCAPIVDQQTDSEDRNGTFVARAMQRDWARGCIVTVGQEAVLG